MESGSNFMSRNMGIHNLSEYVYNIEIKSSNIPLDIITVEKRRNNSKRDFLFVNKWQGKHIPVKPEHFYKMVDALADIIINQIDLKNKVLVVGFAETATALGECLYHLIPGHVNYITTTRERTNKYLELIKFSEEHSHATDQYLYGNNLALGDFNYILFVDDEVTTGKTILNFIREFSKIRPGCKYGIASICNWQDSEAQESYNKLGIDRFSLITGEIRDTTKKIDADENVSWGYDGFEDSGILDAGHLTRFRFLGDNSIYNRRFLGYGNYTIAKHKIIQEALSGSLKGFNNRNICVIGTEEFMDVAIDFAAELSKLGYNVVTHSTTRSPISITGNKSGICSAFKIHSPYDENRVTYIYNLCKYDKVYILTDSISLSNVRPSKFELDMINILESLGNTDIEFICTSKSVEET
jgi:hypothetical protein